MSDADLFGAVADDRPARTPAVPPPPGAPRLMRPDRHQVRFMPTSLEALLPEDHPARSIWAVVERLDLTAYEEEIDAREGHAGRPGIDPRILMALWIYATSEGVGSARRIERLESEHHAYQWICGGVHVNHHALSDFRVQHGEKLNQQFTDVLGVLTHQGLVDLARVAVDGMRIRASAGAASYRREKSLKECLKEARAQVEEVSRQADEAEEPTRQQAARKRAAQERCKRVEAALAALPAIQETKKDGEARVSTTDPEARVMKMGDGGFRPAYNAQFATDVKTRVIVGVSVTNAGSDLGQITPMLANIQKRTGYPPRDLLVDGGYAKKAGIEEAARQGVTVYAPVQKPKQEDVDPHQPKQDDSPSVAEWRRRMGTEEAKEIYKGRAATAETTNADLKTHRGLDRLTVRGIPKVECVILWAALTYNVLKLISLG
jgi:transposase